MRFRNLAAALLLSLFAFTSLAIGQTSNGTITGVVRDASGAVVSGATVVVTNEATAAKRDATTNAEGAFRVEAVDPGPYSVLVSKTGFKGFELKHLDVRPSVITSADVALGVATANAEVTVETANTATLDVESGGITSTIGEQELKTIPIFSMNPVELVQTLPGVQLINGNSALSNGVNVSVNGARPRSNNFLIDGQDDNDNSIGGQALQSAIPDIYSNVIALTNAFSAEYGRGGGAVVNLITKSGTNQIHGSVYDLYSGSGLNAIDGQSRGQGITKTRFDEHQIAFTVGAPIIKDKLFAFGGGQWSRTYGQEQPGVLNLPDAKSLALLQGFNTPASNLLLQYIGSLSQYNLTSTPSSTPAVTIINETGCASCKISFARYIRPAVPEQNPDTQWTAKIDYTPTQKDTISARYLHDATNLTPDYFNFSTQLPGFDTLQGGNSSQGAGSYTHVFSPRIVNEFRFSDTLLNFAFDSTPQTKANPLYTSAPITIANTGFPTLGPASTSLPQGRGHDLYQFQDTISISKGRHTIRIGADVARDIIRDFIPFNNFGTLSYTTSPANAASGLPGYSALNNFIDNFLGTAGAAARSFGSNRVDAHVWQSAFFGQDDIKLSPDLTVNLGLRYEYATNPENAVKFPAINPATVLTDPITALYRVKEDKNNIAPRVGFAYNPHNGMAILADGKTVYHAAFGIFYDVLFTNITDNSQASSPNVQSPNLTQGTGRGLGNALGLVPSLAPLPTISPLNTVQLTSNNLVNPQTFQWNVGLERQLPAEIKLTINYVASRGEKLFSNQQYNTYPYATPGVRTNPARGAIIARINGADSEYQSIQTEVSHDFRHGLFIRGAYTFGKNLDNGSEVFNTFSSPTSYAANLAPGGRAREWGPSQYDFRNLLSISYAYTIPGVPQLTNSTANLFAGIFTRNWQFSGITYFQSGPYSTFNVSGSDVNNDSSATNDRPLVGNPHAPIESAAVDASYSTISALKCAKGPLYDMGQANTNGTCVQVAPATVHWVVPGNYTPAQVNAEINRNSFRNPGYVMFNFALQKAFDLPIKHLEHSNITLRADAQNVFNHNNVGPLGINIFSINVPGTDGDPFMNKDAARFDDNRIVRLWAKFIF
jgi:outer membrane receptor protein involved in Fe transport